MLRSGAFSLALHILVIAGLLSIPPVRRQLEKPVRFVARDVLRLPALSSPKTTEGGGGGGQRSPLPPSLGRLPRAASRQFVPPTPVQENPQPKLIVEPTLVIPADVALPHVDVAVYGDPFGRPGLPSGGPGSGSGIGDGRHGGVGPGKGPGFGPGEDGGVRSGPRAARGDSRGPILIYKVEPEYTDDARKARLQGIILLAAEVDTNGHVRNPRVRQGLGLGLDERALEAVLLWRFRPGLRDGEPISTPALIEVHFHLL